MAPGPHTADALADLAAASPDQEGGPGQWVDRKSAVVPVPDMAGGNQRISVSAADGRFTGYQFLGDGSDLTEADAWGVAILELALVTGPGEYP